MRALHIDDNTISNISTTISNVYNGAICPKLWTQIELKPRDSSPVQAELTRNCDLISGNDTPDLKVTSINRPMTLIKTFLKMLGKNTSPDLFVPNANCSASSHTALTLLQIESEETKN